MSDWIEYAERKPESAGAYRWRLPSTGTPGLFVTFVAHMRLRGAGHESVVSPSFDYWDGYRLLLPQGVQWQEVGGVTDVKWHGYGEVAVEGVEPCACPYCEKVPVLKGAKRYSDGTLSHGASPHEYSSWWLECCSWARTPQYKDPHDLVARRDDAIRPATPTTNWIKCSDKLPPIKQKVLVYRLGNKTNDGPFFAMTCGNEHRPWRWLDGDRCDITPTHWHEVPTPPTE